MFLTLMYFTFYGMMAIGLTPSQHLGAVISSAFYSLWNLLSGFLIPKPVSKGSVLSQLLCFRFIVLCLRWSNLTYFLCQRLPGWWLWFYYLCPVAWTLRGIITSQLGDVETMVVGPGFEGTVKEYLQEYLGFGPGMTGITAAVLVAFSLLFFIVYALSIKILNYQRRWSCYLKSIKI